MRTLVIGNTDGIGLALTRRLLAAGHQVEGISRRDSPLQHAAYRHHVCDVATDALVPMLRELVTRPLDLCIY